jgi:hypothetical protein
MKKHNTRDKDEAYSLEIDELKKSYKPSQEALEYLEQLNLAYKGKKIKFYYTHPMLNYFSIDDPDCDQVPIYEVFCQSVELVDEESIKMPMIITKDKNYPLIDVVDIEIVENEIDRAKKNNEFDKDKVLELIKLFQFLAYNRTKSKYSEEIATYLFDKLFEIISCELYS